MKNLSFYKNMIKETNKTLKDIDNISSKKIILEKYIDEINRDIKDDIKKQKNRLLLKFINNNLKNVKQENIILSKTNNIILIKESYIEDGLLFIYNIYIK